jgi:hypothetical protein
VSFVSTAGARMPHVLFDVASWHLSGGSTTAELTPGFSVGYAFDQWPGSIDLFAWSSASGSQVATSHEAYLSEIRSMANGPTYAEELTKAHLAVRATLVSGPLPSGGNGVWFDLAFGGKSWHVNTGGTIGETATTVLFIELAEAPNPGVIGGGGVISDEAIGRVLAANTYTITSIRV